MRFLRPLLSLTTLDCQRNPDIRDRLKVNNLKEDKIISKELVRSPEKSGQMSLTQSSFSIQTLRMMGCWKTQEKMEEPRTP
jgi:hypothetical protein